MKRILFVCTWNAIRSPMAAAMCTELHPNWQIESAGIYEEPIDPFAVAVMAEIGLDISGHDSQTLASVKGNLDISIALSPPAAEALAKLPDTVTGTCQTWNLYAPTDAEGNREQRLTAYRQLREELKGLLATLNG
jgi:protein-tyrosine-phosphatase